MREIATWVTQIRKELLQHCSSQVVSLYALMLKVKFMWVKVGA